MTGVKQKTPPPEGRQIIEDLKPFLDGAKRRLMATFPKDAVATILDTTEQLVRSGIADKAAGAGERAPLFTLTSHTGESVSLDELLSHGPVVLAFFRGFW